MVLAYLDTNSGIAGDMTLAALVDAGADQTYLQQQIDSLGLPGVALSFEETQRHCFRALKLTVKHPPEHAHRHLSDIEAMIDRSALTSREREMSHRLFRRLGAAEAKVHGTSIESVHFHEVGAVDSIVDICGVAIALCNLNVTRIIASPTPTGTGTIQIAHGKVSVPAPATAELLRGIPVQHSDICAELTTPTGAAILSTLVDGFGSFPDMQLTHIGYGAGHKDLEEQANLLRVMIGQPLVRDTDQVVVLDANLDDVTGEQIGFAVDQLWNAGALDVYTTAIGMKKGRPATQLSVICQPELRNDIEACIFRHSGTLGIRRVEKQRTKLHRETVSVETPWGEVRVKVAWPPAANQNDDNQHEPRFAPEYEDCRRIAEQKGESLESVFRLVLESAGKRVSSLTQPASVGEPSLSNDHSHSHDHSHDHHHH